MLENTDQSKFKIAKKQIRQIEQIDGIGAIIITKSKWNELKAYEKALVFYIKIAKSLEFQRRKKLKPLANDF